MTQIVEIYLCQCVRTIPIHAVNIIVADDLAMQWVGLLEISHAINLASNLNGSSHNEKN